jgi:arsenate reductase (glutaredoxin)
LHNVMAPARADERGRPGLAGVGDGPAGVDQGHQGVGNHRDQEPRSVSVMEVQIFGTQKDASTRKALRFFAERGVKVHFVDLKERPMSPGELRRFTEKFGLEALIDRESRRFGELGLAAAPPGGDRWITRLLEEPLFLRQPLVRSEQRLTVGLAEAEWKGWGGKGGGK